MAAPTAQPDLYSRCSRSHLTQLFYRIDAGKTLVIILLNSYGTPTGRHRFLLPPLFLRRSHRTHRDQHPL